MNTIDPIGPRKIEDGSKKSLKNQQVNDKHPSFKKMLNGLVNEVNDIQNKADVSIEKMENHKITNVNQAVDSVQEANLAFDMMMKMRNKVLDAYQEVIKLRS